MRIKVFICSVTLLCVFSAPGPGQERVRCGSNLDSAGEAIICAYFASKKADAEMTRVYEQLTSKLSGSDRDAQEKLTKAQSLWLGYRDATCDSEASHLVGGSLYSQVRNSCLASVTRERTHRLKAYVTKMGNP